MYTTTSSIRDSQPTTTPRPRSADDQASSPCSRNSVFDTEITGMTRERVEQWLTASSRRYQRRNDHWAPNEPTAGRAAQEARVIADLLRQWCHGGAGA